MKSLQYISNNHVPYKNWGVLMILNEGIVHSGEYAGWKIQIVDDTAGETGGYYLILQHGNIECFDYWFEKKSILTIN